MQGETKVVNSRFCDVVIALGSNQGDRRAHLAYAISALESLFTEVRASPFVETVAEGVGGQPDFLNGVVVGLTALLPQDLMKALLEIEKERGRLRPYPGAPRTLDLDLILLGSCMFENKQVQVPHPRFRQRRFVLEPLVGIAPELVDPVTGSTMSELLSCLNRPLR
ncbi:MAG TPA: 2-amino-4-hydroxy-6-hydroxymethyldihydropteridine diphosphokinase [Acidobacteria bacterium]|nr:2-amino-4-hydroxy-6-hydroxymethyldihydropteridine diphosphokinase [Acidobacteriota bacterium]